MNNLIAETDARNIFEDYLRVRLMRKAFKNNLNKTKDHGTAFIKAIEQSSQAPINENAFDRAMNEMAEQHQLIIIPDVISKRIQALKKAMKAMARAKASFNKGTLSKKPANLNMIAGKAFKLMEHTQALITMTAGMKKEIVEAIAQSITLETGE